MDCLSSSTHKLRNTFFSFNYTFHVSKPQCFKDISEMHTLFDFYFHYFLQNSQHLIPKKLVQIILRVLFQAGKVTGESPSRRTPQLVWFPRGRRWQNWLFLFLYSVWLEQFGFGFQSLQDFTEDFLVGVYSTSLPSKHFCFWSDLIVVCWSTFFFFLSFTSPMKEKYLS